MINLNFEKNNLIFIDNHIVVVRKPAGMLTQGDKTGDISLFEITKEYIKKKYQKPGNVYLGLVHRLDRPVSGVVIFTRTSKAAARLNEQIRNRKIIKIYWALVQGKPAKEGQLIDYINRNEMISKISDENKGKKVELKYRLLKHLDDISLLEIELRTGRHHQIRVQFASRDYPILGDFRYGSRIKFGNKALGLHAYNIKITHPVQRTEMSFVSLPEENWPRDFLPENKESQ